MGHDHETSTSKKTNPKMDEVVEAVAVGAPGEESLHALVHPGLAVLGQHVLHLLHLGGDCAGAGGACMPACAPGCLRRNARTHSGLEAAGGPNQDLFFLFLRKYLCLFLFYEPSKLIQFKKS